MSGSRGVGENHHLRSQKKSYKPGKGYQDRIEGANMRKWSFIIALMVVLGVFISALTILPDITKASTLYAGGAGPGNYTSIQGAIDDASSGDTVHVFGGVYYENVIVNKTISLVGEGRDTTTIDGNGTGGGVQVSADWVNITGFTVANGGQSLELIPYFVGMGLHYAQNCNITGNNISDNQIGLSLHYSNNTTITGNVISSNHNYGVFVAFSGNTTIVDNNVSSNWEAGIILYDSSGNNVVNNTLLWNVGYGTVLSQSSNNTITNNTLFDNSRGGFYVYRSTNTTMVSNSMVKDGLVIGGNSLEHWNSHTIDTSNTVNGKPLHYWKNVVGGTIPPDSGGVILANCTDVTVENQTLTNSSAGVSLGFSSDITIANNTISDNWDGIKLYMSNSSTITANTIHNNRYWVGIFLTSSSKNAILRNHISHNGEGVILAGFSEDNWVYHNNFVNNTKQASTSEGTNHWDNGYPSGGNYWSDYNGTDNCSGPNQDNCPDLDGIGDTPYTIDVDSQDGYPLMEPLPLEIPSPGNQRPICEIVQPVEHERTHETYTITGIASDEDGTIVEVEIRIDNGSWILVNGNTSWSYEWDTTSVSNGEYTIYARSYDGEDYSDEVNVTVDVHNPTEEEMMYGEIFFWTAVVLVVVIAITGLLLEVKRRKKEES